MADDVDMMVRPKIGAPYMVGQPVALGSFSKICHDSSFVMLLQVWPAVHSYLTKKKLKTISPKEVHTWCST